MTPLARLLARAETAPDGCWLWTGAISARGYGQIGVGGKTRSTHRVAYECMVGAVPPGLQIDHTCHNTDPTCAGGVTCRHRRCLNPAHLEAVTALVNLSRSPNQPVGAVKCGAGHDYSAENTAYRKDSGTRICRACQRAYGVRRLKGYGKPGRPSKAAVAALATTRNAAWLEQYAANLPRYPAA